MKKYIVIAIMAIISASTYAQVLVGGTNSTLIPDAGPIFVSGNNNVGARKDTLSLTGKGLYFPRVDLAKVTSFGSVPTVPPAAPVNNEYNTRLDGLIVYNIANGGVAGNSNPGVIGATEGTLTPGFWYYENKSTTFNGGIWKPLGSGVVVADTPANGDVKYEGGGLKYWDVDQWKPLSGQGLVPPTHDPNVTVGLTGGKTEIMVGEIITLTSSEGVTWLLAQSDDYAELINGDSQLKGLAPGIVTVRATTADNRYNEFTVTVKSANNPDGSGNLNVGSNTYKTYEYSGVTWMVTNSKEGTSSAQKYNNDNSRVNGYYYTWAQAAGACPAGWRLPAQAEWNSLIAWINSNKTSEGAKFWITDAGSAFAGYYYTGWYHWGTDGFWWGASSGLYGLGYTGGVGTYTDTTSYWFSVRCVKNNPL